jgi:hypothetical protein
MERTLALPASCCHQALADGQEMMDCLQAEAGENRLATNSPSEYIFGIAAAYCDGQASEFQIARAGRFIFLRAGYSTHKRFVLGGEECAAPFAGKTFVSCGTLMTY